MQPQNLTFLCECLLRGCLTRQKNMVKLDFSFSTHPLRQRKQERWRSSIFKVNRRKAVTCVKSRYCHNLAILQQYTNSKCVKVNSTSQSVCFCISYLHTQFWFGQCPKSAYAFRSEETKTCTFFNAILRFLILTFISI